MRTRWLVEPKNEYANETLSRIRPGDEIQEVEVTLPGNRTKKVKAWQVSFSDLTFLERSKHKGLDYQAHSQEGNGQIRPHRYLLNKRSDQKRKAALKAMAQELKKINKQ